MPMSQGRRRFVLIIYVIATVQFVWCYLWLTRPYVGTWLYENGLERMPFQGRCLMMLPLRLAHQSVFLNFIQKFFAMSRFWFPTPVKPEVLVQAVIWIASLLVAGFFTTRMYQVSSRRHLLTPVVYPLFLVVCGGTYIMHTVQNFRFVYDLPSLAFYSVAMYLIYMRRHWAWFAALFVVATSNRETTLLLLPLYLIDASVQNGQMRWRNVLRLRPLAVVAGLLVFWMGWEAAVRHIFAHNPTEFYPRLDWNVKSILAPYTWPQMISACAYLLPFVLLMRRRLLDAQLRAWLWLLPFWWMFMFAYGILVETRIFGELIPMVVCSAALIGEEILMARMPRVLESTRQRAEEPRAEVTRAAA